MSSPTAAARTPDNPAPAKADDQLVPVFNKSPKGGDYIHLIFEDVKDEAGKVIARRRIGEWRAQAGTFSRIPGWLAKQWKREAPTIIVDPETIGAPDNQTPQPEVVRELKSQNADLEKRLKNMEKLVADLQATRPGNE